MFGLVCNECSGGFQRNPCSRWRDSHWRLCAAPRGLLLAPSVVGHTHQQTDANRRYVGYTRRVEPTESQQYEMADARLARSASKRWVKDDEVLQCPLCTNSFEGLGFLDITARGRTHCRYCGGVFCTDCCNQELYMPEDEV